MVWILSMFIDFRVPPTPVGEPLSRAHLKAFLIRESKNPYRQAFYQVSGFWARCLVGPYSPLPCEDQAQRAPKQKTTDFVF